jgi:hypothetical protein
MDLKGHSIKGGMKKRFKTFNARCSLRRRPDYGDPGNKHIKYLETVEKEGSIKRHKKLTLINLKLCLRVALSVFYTK